jgi:hypothetical protein
MQQNQSRFSLIRRTFFPFTGEEPLTRAQEIRVIITWAIIFPIVLLICSLPVVAIDNNASLQRIALLLLLIFVGGVIIFALTAWFVVWIVNRTARLAQQQRRADESARMNNSSGGRYGS